MKKVLITLLLSFATISAFAADITGAKIIENEHGSRSLWIDVRYGGGCKEHQFKLEMVRCYKSDPVQCEAKLKDLTVGDHCKALISKSIGIPFTSVGLDDCYFEGGSLRITGDNKTSATVILPKNE